VSKAQVIVVTVDGRNVNNPVFDVFLSAGCRAVMIETTGPEVKVSGRFSA
jgi:hypothetical protein